MKKVLAVLAVMAMTAMSASAFAAGCGSNVGRNAPTVPSSTGAGGGNNNSVGNTNGNAQPTGNIGFHH